MDRKAAKEAFVSGLRGASKPEVFALVASLSLSIVLCELAKTGLRFKSWWNAALLELALVVYLQLLLCTAALPLAATTWTCAALAAAGCALQLLAAAPSASVSDVTPPSPPQNALAALQALASKRKSFISSFRGALMLATCIAILAVDFHAFPRRYAKAETYGTGYMDVGVGGVVLAAGLVSPVAVAAAGSSSDAASWKPAPLLRRVWTGLRGAAVCWALGLARLATTRAVDYQEHVGEYGVHWNFFDTIAVVALLGAAVAVPPGRLAAAAVAVTVAHQAALTLGGLGPWVMSPHRDPASLLSLNKEGLVSAPGFYALFLWGAALARAMHTGLQRAVAQAVEAAGAAAGAARQRPVAREGDEGRESRLRQPQRRALVLALAAPVLQWWCAMAGLDTALWAAVAALEVYVEPVSRRSCNAAYVMWIAAQLLAGLLPLALAQALAAVAAAAATGSTVEAPRPLKAAASGAGEEGGETQREVEKAGGAAGGAPMWGPAMLQAINAAQLPVFLTANLLTGAVNLSLDTMQVPDWPARALLGMYITAVCAVAVALQRAGLRLKL
ncbi:hypothetical protein HYH02_009290 [Chlamydomonas schloesseri]|uniref:Phosphatidylinositol-glycan biosynthesis class W protein n=1 Tax=Chlamydomonas schloesseri TaxID=2026947 RepID=A0A835W9Z2_9CHLO|nr:hypothetical protein HYH02_009290 [Chlamydomonas schloesseri]|eukprot:KAG2443216.1 hypothetical protein HYH02_009290 [Chlamydomonas schloesseri]